MDRRFFLGAVICSGIATCLGIDKIINDKNKTFYCKIEDFWDKIKYREERKNNVIQKNIYRVEDYPKCSMFTKIDFSQLKNEDYFIIIPHKNDYMGPNTGYGFISKATSEVFKTEYDVLGVQLSSVNIPQCWTEEAFRKHMITSGCNFHDGTKHYKNGKLC